MAGPSAPNAAVSAHCTAGRGCLGRDAITGRIVLVLAALAAAAAPECSVGGTDCDECVELEPMAAQDSMQRLQVRDATGPFTRCGVTPFAVHCTGRTGRRPGRRHRVPHGTLWRRRCGGWRVSASAAVLTIRPHPRSPYRPGFDCGGACNLLVANSTDTAGHPIGGVRVSGLRVRRGRAVAGGPLDHGRAALAR